jgi:arginine deiminase
MRYPVMLPGNAIHVSSETGTLKRLLIHSPDRGLGKVVPSKAQDWLFEDIVHLDTMRRGEYDYYVKLLLYFLDPDKIKGKLSQIDSDPPAPFSFQAHRKNISIPTAWLTFRNCWARSLKMTRYASS